MEPIETSPVETTPEPPKRRHYSADEKSAALAALHEQPGVTVAAIAARFNIGVNTLNAWRQEQRRAANGSDGAASHQAELVAGPPQPAVPTLLEALADIEAGVAALKNIEKSVILLRALIGVK